MNILKGVNILRTLSTARREVPRLVPLMRDARVPGWAKVAAALAALLVLSPINILGDIPFLGFVDDAALLVFVMHLFVTFAEKRIMHAVETYVPSPSTVRSSAIPLGTSPR